MSRYRVFQILAVRIAVLVFGLNLIVFSALAQEPSTSSSNTEQSHPSEHASRVRVSQGVSEGFLIKKVQPKYPKAARKAGVQGSVVLQIVIDTDGKVKDLKPVVGDPSLTPAAIDAVKRWKYKPYMLDSHRVEMETQVVIAFKLTN